MNNWVAALDDAYACAAEAADMSNKADIERERDLSGSKGIEVVALNGTSSGPGETSSDRGGVEVWARDKAAMTAGATGADSTVSKRGVMSACQR